MKTIADYLEPEAMKQMAIPSNLRLGKEIADRNGVEIMESSPDKLSAKVKLSGLQTRTVVFNTIDDRLNWTCTCSKKGNFCKHCVAVGLTIHDKRGKGKKK